MTVVTRVALKVGKRVASMADGMVLKWVVRMADLRDEMKVVV